MQAWSLVTSSSAKDHNLTAEEEYHEGELRKRRPPLSPFFVGLWRRRWALFTEEKHGDSQHTATRRAHTHIAITKEAKNKRRGGGGGQIEEAERRPMRTTRPHRSKGEFPPLRWWRQKRRPNCPWLHREYEKSGSTRVLRTPPVKQGNGTRLSQDGTTQRRDGHCP